MDIHCASREFRCERFDMGLVTTIRLSRVRYGSPEYDTVLQSMIRFSRVRYGSPEYDTSLQRTIRVCRVRNEFPGALIHVSSFNHSSQPQPDTAECSKSLNVFLRNFDSRVKSSLPVS